MTDSKLHVNEVDMSIFNLSINEVVLLHSINCSATASSFMIGKRVNFLLNKAMLSGRGIEMWSNSVMRRKLNDMAKRGFIERGELVPGRYGFMWTITEKGEKRLREETDRGALNWMKDNE